MAEDSEFETILGVIVSTEFIVNNMIENYHEEYEKGKSPINYFEPGGQVRNILDSTANEGFQLRWLLDKILRNSFVQTAEGQFLDIWGALFGVPRKAEVKSTGLLTFSDPDGDLTETIYIPAYTRVAMSGDTVLEFETTVDARLDPFGEVTIPAQCIYGGDMSNVGRNKIDTIIEDNLELQDLTVINNTPFLGGEEEEEDDPYRYRILEHNKNGNKVGTPPWYKAQAESIEGVHDVVVINVPGGKYTVGIVVNANNKAQSDVVVNRVRDFFLREDQEIGGMTVLVKKADEKPVNFEINGTLARGFDKQTATEMINDDLRAFIEGGITSRGIRYAGFNSGDTMRLTGVYNVLLEVRALQSFTLALPRFDVDSRTEEVLIMGSSIINI
jgi:uncharacterized phage protein gp47/JayE